jgi:hypothetical protein
MSTLGRRRFVTTGLVFLAACRHERRCKNCGMRIDPASAWRTELVTSDGLVVEFDTPRCAFASWRSGKTTATALRAQEYYARTWTPGGALVFAIGSDVVGPMGADLVPISPRQAGKFLRDHGPDRVLQLDEITLQVVSALK